MNLVRYDPFMTYSHPEALGREVRELRKALKLTQDELGKRAGYRTGAGVSVSRLENGQLRPGAERLQGIAEALGLTPEELEARASHQSVDNVVDSATGHTPSGANRLEDRFKRVQQTAEARKKDVAALSGAFDQAQDRAHTQFLARFVEIAARIDGAPKPNSTPFQKDDAEAATDQAAAHQFQATSEGVAQLLSGGAGDAATNLALSLLRGVAVAAGSAGGGKGLAGIVAGPALLLASGGAVWMFNRDRKHQQQLAVKLDLAEAELNATKTSFEALSNILPRATEILDYIAIHAAHALARWEKELGAGPLAWNRLSESDRQHYQDFIDIAAAQIMVLRTNFQGLLTPEDGDELKLLTMQADTALTQAQGAVHARV